MRRARKRSRSSRKIRRCVGRRMPPCESSSSTAGAGDSRWREWAEPSDLEHPVEDQLEVLVAGLADPAAVLRHVAFLGSARDVAGLERHPAELAVVMLGAHPLRPVVREAKQLFAKPVLTLQAPIVLSDHVVFLHGTGTPALAVAPSSLSHAAPFSTWTAMKMRVVTGSRCGGRGAQAGGTPASKASVRVMVPEPRVAGFFCPHPFGLGAGPGRCASLSPDGEDRRGPH